MIQVMEVTKRFDNICALEKISLVIPEGIVYGLLGTNGSGKTTLLRIMSGILDADYGKVKIDCGETGREEVFYLPDEPYYFANASMEEMARFYGRQYPKMDRESVRVMGAALNLDPDQPLRTFSKGMKRQAFLILALCSGTKYLLCDEVFDGLDPVAVEIMKNLFRQEMKERKFTVLVASHKLYDLEDICEKIAILHRGGVVTSGNLKERAADVRKFQCVFQNKGDAVDLGRELNIIRCVTDCRFTTLIIRDSGTDTTGKILRKNPVFCEEVPMSLEEIFIAEMEAEGYDIRKVLY